jgi:pilus assembly protein Flp/PilA
MTKLLKKLAGDRSGATAIEYGLIAAFIALALAGTLPAVRDSLTGVFQSIQGDLDTAATPSS